VSNFFAPDKLGFALSACQTTLLNHFEEEMTSKLCIGCERSLKPYQRRTLKSSEVAISFLIKFGKIWESKVRSSSEDSEAYLCKPCLKVLEESSEKVEQLGKLLSGCRQHFGLANVTIAALDVPVENFEEGGFVCVMFCPFIGIAWWK
jgi:hypothetical protein